MLDKKEKMVMSFFYDQCLENKTRLFSAQEIVQYVENKKQIISLAELAEILITLSKENLIDFVESESKNGSVYCVSLKPKGLVFKKDLEKEKRHSQWLILRTALLAILSFVIGILLRALFG